jgi:hypothetical protein
MARVAVQRDASGLQRFHVTVDRPDGYLQFSGELIGGQLAPALQQQQDRDKTASAHGRYFP